MTQDKPVVEEIVHKISDAGGKALLVGGAVRDIVLGKPVKDLDIEVHGVPLEVLQKILAAHGPVSLVGKSFGVLRIHGLEVDWSLPRTDEAGRKPRVTIDVNLPLEQAFSRRDLTMNAMGIDLNTQELLDPFGGLQDIKKKRLRAPDADSFAEDPLRLFRVMQFIGRFEMDPTPELDEICKKVDVRKVSRERIEGELEKLLLKSARPSRGFRWLRCIGRLKELFPELAATIDVPQNPAWHPEGDVFEHTMQAIDVAAQIPYEDPEKKLVLMYAALCHDLGKQTTTKKIDGVWRSLGHGQAGVPLAKQLLKRITRNKDVIAAVQKLVCHHMDPMQFVEGKAKPAAYKRLAQKLAPHTTLRMLTDLAYADKRGRGVDGIPLSGPISDIDEFERHARKARVCEQVEAPILHGRDLMPRVAPGPLMGRLLEYAYELQIDEEIRDKRRLKALVLARLKNNSFSKDTHSDKLSSNKKMVQKSDKKGN